MIQRTGLPQFRRRPGASQLHAVIHPFLFLECPSRSCGLGSPTLPASGPRSPRPRFSVVFLINLAAGLTLVPVNPKTGLLLDLSHGVTVPGFLSVFPTAPWGPWRPETLSHLSLGSQEPRGQARGQQGRGERAEPRGQAQRQQGRGERARGRAAGVHTNPFRKHTSPDESQGRTY